MNHLTLKALKPRDTKYSEPCGDNLYLNVYPTGRKVWAFHGRINGKVTTKVLGNFPEMSEKSARATMDALNMKKESPIVRDIMSKVFELKVANGKILPKYASQDQRRFNSHLPALAAMRIDEITAPVAIAHLKPLAAKTKTAAQKMAQILKSCEKFAVNAGMKDSYCLQGISEYFPSVMANIKHRTACKPSEFGKVMEGLAQSKHQNLVNFALYTLLRISEVVAARADWINWETMSLDVPAENMKMKRTHRVPITPQLKNLLEQLPREGWLFPTQKGSASGHVCNHFIEKQFFPVWDLCCPHGVRSVGRTFMSENRVPFDVAEECLAHVRGNVVSRAYDRCDLLEERREVMEKWCAFVDSKRPSKQD